MTRAPRVDPNKERRDLMTVVLEDYFHVGAMRGLIRPHQWNRFETRFESNTLKALDLLKKNDVKATFFVLGWVAERQPELVAEIARQGHEIANYGYAHRDVQQMTRGEFRDDARRSRDLLEIASGRRVIGFRIPQGLRSDEDLWVLDALAEEGYVYDSSVVPYRYDRASRGAFLDENDGRELWEFPHATMNLFGYLLPISGGNYFRQIPHTLLQHAVARWKRQFDTPFMMYFHVWELDPDQPRISAASWMARTRQYRNLKKMDWVLSDYFSKYKFDSIANFLDVNTTPDTPVAVRPKAPAPPVEVLAPPVARVPVSIVVPCFNERPALPYLSNTLESVSKLLAKDYAPRFVFVDDGSTDGTWELLNRLFGTREDCRLVKNEINRGVAASILTGIRYASDEIVCSMDCDCTYDPHELVHMIPLLTPDVDLVTASPYHPQGGRVMNVPGWRLVLSKGASWLYSKVLRHKLHTYTSCFRVYRRSAVADLELKEMGFLGVSETLALLDLRGHNIREFPTTLYVRILGQSKMKVARNIVGHLKNLWRMRQMRRLLDDDGQFLAALQATPSTVPPAAADRSALKSLKSKIGVHHE
jgi:polysaccharide deacetylase family protein (PEP-CTERM system associated)